MRKKGFYWIKDRAGNWFVGEWVKEHPEINFTGPCWLVFGFTLPHYDYDFEFIDEDKIKNTNE